MTRWPTGKRIWRSGVRFDCPECGRLWRDDDEHGEVREGGCLTCQGDIKLVGRGESIVEFARWYRCKKCSELFMFRRGELVVTGPRSGFAEYT